MAEEPRSTGTAVLRVDPPARAELPVTLGPALAELLDVALGAVALAVDAVMVRLDGGAGPGPAGRAPLVPARMLVDAGLGAGWEVLRTGGRMVGGAADLARPVAVVLLDPPLLPVALRPITGLRALARRSEREQRRTATALVARSAQVDLTGSVEQVVARLDLDELAATVVARLDLDTLAGTVVSRLDLEQLVASVLGRLDLGAVVSAVLDQVDLTELVIRRVDLEQVVTTALDGLDLTALVLDRVDLARVVDGALDEIDLTALVMQRVDLVRVAEYVVDAIDLPEIIRESTGSVASEAVRGVRIQSIEADDAIGRTVDRLLRRRRPRSRADSAEEPTGPDPGEPA